MQVSKWLGHSTYTLMLDVYGDYIPEQDGGSANTLPEPPAPRRTVEAAGGKVVELFGRQANYGTRSRIGVQGWSPTSAPPWVSTVMPRKDLCPSAHRLCLISASERRRHRAPFQSAGGSPPAFLNQSGARNLLRRTPSTRLRVHRIPRAPVSSFLELKPEPLVELTHRWGATTDNWQQVNRITACLKVFTNLCRQAVPFQQRLNV
jgi:hypothetical protein